MATRQDFALGRRAIVTGLVGAVTALLGGCGSDDAEVFGKSLPGYRYKLAAAVQTPDGVRTGHSVVEVNWHRGSSLLGTQRSAGFEYHGEAVAVDLPRGQTLFILLRTKDNVDWPAWALNGVVENVADVSGEDRRPHPVPRTIRIGVDDIPNYPWFVRFRDIRNPATVEEVDPDDLARSFGPGVSLKSLTVQITDEPMSRGVMNKIPWWAQYLDRHLDGSVSRYEDMRIKDIAAHLSSGSFSTETEQ